MGDEPDIPSAMRALREIRAKKREDAVRLGALLETASTELRGAIGDHPLIDPITQEQLLSLEWTPNDRNGFSLAVSALNGKYAFVLEVYYEHGGVLGSAIRCGDDDDAFYDLVFRGTPLRLTKDADGRVNIVRRGKDDKEHTFPILTLLSTFINAISFRERRGP